MVMNGRSQDLLTIGREVGPFIISLTTERVMTVSMIPGPRAARYIAISPSVSFIKFNYNSDVLKQIISYDKNEDVTLILFLEIE